MPTLGKLCLLYTPTLCVADPLATLAAAIEGGVDLVQWRSKTEDPDGFARCVALCRERGTPVVVNDDVALAARAQTAGAHVGQDDMPARSARALLPGRLLGVSTHDLEQIRDAVEAGADYVGFGPCRATETKGYAEGVGDAAIAAAAARCDELRLPMFAIGGITAQNLPQLLGLGVRRIAVSGFVLRHADPRAAAATLRGLMG